MKVTRLSLLGILGISMLLTGCGGSSTKSSLSQVGVMEKDFYDQWVVPGKLDEQLVKKGSANALKDVGIWKMYGQFNGAFVLSFHVNGIGAGTVWLGVFTVRLGTSELWFSVPWTPHVWSNSPVYSLEDAYNAKIIVDADLPLIQKAAQSADKSTYFA